MGYCRIEDDVPVVGHGQELAPYPLDVADAIVGEVVDSVVYAPGHGIVHHNLLKLVYAPDGLQGVAKIGDRLVREKIF